MDESPSDSANVADPSVETTPELDNAVGTQPLADSAPLVPATDAAQQ